MSHAERWALPQRAPLGAWSLCAGTMGGWDRAGGGTGLGSHTNSKQSPTWAGFGLVPRKKKSEQLGHSLDFLKTCLHRQWRIYLDMDSLTASLLLRAGMTECIIFLLPWKCNFPLPSVPAILANVLKRALPPLYISTFLQSIPPN